MNINHASPAKKTLVTEIKELLSKSKSVAVVDYKGLKVSQISELRKAIKKAGGHMLVTKNTLFKIASGHTDLKLEGTSAFVFSMNDEVSALKIVADYAKKNQLPTFKLGILEDRVLTATEVAELSALPDKPTMVAKLLGTVKSPLFALTYNLNWNITKLVRTIDAVRQSKS